MGIFRRIFGGDEQVKQPVKPQRLDYLNEALALERQGDFDAAIVSYRLALRDHPNDPRILQNLAIAQSRTGSVLCVPVTSSVIMVSSKERAKARIAAPAMALARLGRSTRRNVCQPLAPRS